ncbi:hypothetical protein KEJ25_09475 [Candidatus Bathyarchaeota archaeon]|nr:hypothetical protein [Candidatus Bathyarchaeota archaeon]
MAIGYCGGSSNPTRKITYVELKHYYIKGVRSGRIRMLNKVEKGFYKACMAFARVKAAIVSPKLTSMLSSIVDKLKPIGLRAFEEGRRRAKELKVLFRRSGVFKWAPRVKDWLKEESYMIYLGFMEMYSPPRFEW